MIKWLIFILFIFLSNQIQAIDIKIIDSIKKRDYQSIKIYEKPCKSGLGSMYCSQIAKIYAKYKEYDKAITYYQMGCNGKKTDSCYELGKFHLVINQQKDTFVYEYYLDIACEDGNKNACKDLAIHYEVQDDNQSKFYYARACALGLVDYCSKINNNP